ncbi:hypothetical protein CDAR_198811 [Caerostris darwini]|uniref:15-hydroxyprostaglandin dehydrogenase [NAD(+)] n=1 Tax=Caerostris darwini TaxID=1538125 RepID=A0AAV4U9A7_9ARAC|nr:hypothetical protein CDAR_198811 [Caerostris darwini]
MFQILAYMQHYKKNQCSMFNKDSRTVSSSQKEECVVNVRNKVLAPFALLLMLGPTSPNSYRPISLLSTVCICDIKEDAALEFMQNLPADLKTNVVFQKCDVTSFTDLKNAFDYVISTFGRLDMLINNAGICSEQNYQKMIEINFIAVVNATKIAFELMNINNGGRGGHIISTASNAGLEIFPLGPVYAGTKHAIVGFTKSLGTGYHFRKTGITVKCYMPRTRWIHICSEVLLAIRQTKQQLKLISSCSTVISFETITFNKNDK